jgi:DNA adenine methylase
VEPFVGAGAMFLNTRAKKYLLNDINADLINLYRFLQQEQLPFIKTCEKYFSGCHNYKDRYYAHRARFNKSQSEHFRAILFLYLNRHGYNGLCRYNLKGEYNVPFGDYCRPYFPEKEMLHFISHFTQAKFYNESFVEFFKRLLRSKQLKYMSIYCDPPYAPLTQTANFTGYAANKFGWQDQEQLTELAWRCARKGAQVFISNHDTPAVRELYTKAQLHSLQVTRTISRDTSNRNKVGELLAHFR